MKPQMLCFLLLNIVTCRVLLVVVVVSRLVKCCTLVLFHLFKNVSAKIPPLKLLYAPRVHFHILLKNSELTICLAMSLITGRVEVIYSVCPLREILYIIHASNVDKCFEVPSLPVEEM